MVRVWTRQKKSVLEELRKTGRYTAKRKYIEMDLTEHAALVLEAYDWLVANGPDAAGRRMWNIRFGWYFREGQP